jgi:DNA ligase-1
VVACDRATGSLLLFQVLTTRKRQSEGGEEEIQIVLEVFDLLYINGMSLLDESLRTRRNILHAALQPVEGFLYFAAGCDHVENGDTEPIEAFLQQACSSQCEGLMVKTLDSNATYEPSKRSLNWLKLKKDYIDGMGVCDSVDLVVLGGYYGRGKRANTYGAYLMACYDPERDEFQSVCKVGTGFKDEDLARLCDQMKGHIVPSKRKPLNYNVGDPLFPDDWFEPRVVWEIQVADLSLSSVHKGGVDQIETGRGIGLRFPRYLRDRPDKKPENATSTDQIVDLYRSQGGSAA